MSLAKVALQVLLVILAAVVLVRFVDWTGQLYRRETLPADLKPMLSDLSPEDVIRRCGTPDVQQINDLVFRELFYRRSGASVRFIRGTGKTGWMFSSITLVGNSGPQNDLHWQLSSMPCLNTANATN
jgi:hypothetical protein